MAKQQPDLRIDRLGTHLFQVTRKDGSNFLKWDWDKLLEEVQAATADRRVHYLDVGDLSPKEATALVKKVTKAVKAKKNLVKETETKVTKTRAKKAEEKDSPATTKPAAKKAPAKKPAAKKTTSKTKKA